MLRAGGGVVPAAAWTPLSMPNLAAWFRDTIVGSPVDQWTDLSGNARHALGSGGTRPIYTASDATLNNLPSVGFTQFKYLQSALPALSDPFAVFAVAYCATADLGAIFDDAAFPGIAKHFQFAAGNMRILEGGNVTGAAYSNNTKTFVGALFNGASSIIWKDARTGIAANATSSTAATTGFTVGNNRNLDTGAATFAEYLIVTGSPAQADIDSLGTYLAARYAMTIGA